MENLDLNVHSVEEILGKVVVINGAEYVFAEFLAEGGESFVYVLRNRTSDLIEFVGKIYKFRPGSEEYELKKTRTSATEFVMKAHGISTLQTEYYEIPGALIGLQEFGGGEYQPARVRELLEQAARDVKGGKHADAIRCYDEVLGLNPNHTNALFNKAACLDHLGALGEALGLLAAAIRIEPNDTFGYHSVARILVSVGRPEAAIQNLEQTLQRWKIDFPTWKLLIEIALKSDLVDVATAGIDEVVKIVSIVDADITRFEEIGRWRDELEKSKLRKSSYDNYMQQALQAQEKKMWSEAVQYCTRAIESSSNNFIARLNRGCCQFHLGLGKEVADELSELLYPLRGIAQFACAAVAMVAFTRARDFENAKRLALLLNDMIENPMDLPRIPILITNEFAQEIAAIEELTSAIRAVPRNVSLSSEEAIKIDELLSKYAKLDAATSS